MPQNDCCSADKMFKIIICATLENPAVLPALRGPLRHHTKKNDIGTSPGKKMKVKLKLDKID